MPMWTIFFILFFIPFHFTMAEESNAGIVKGLWYDQELFFADEPIRIYVAIRNNTGSDLSGTVEFFANGERIEKNFINALNGRVVESWTDWTPGYGTSTVSATLSRTEISSTASGTKSITLTSAIAEDTIFIDYDTDKDNIGNSGDNDDDGDGVSDEDEINADTNPLIYNDPEITNQESTGKETDLKDDVSKNSNEIKPDKPEGLEKFLTNNRVGNTLSSVTNIINTNKDKLDEYRESRAIANDKSNEERRGGEAATSDTLSSKSTVNEPEELEENIATTSHIGEITRSTEKANGNLSTLTKSIFEGLKTLVIFIYDSILFVLSKYLSHPILVQLSLLLLILFLILKLAQRFSKRQY